MRKCAWCVCVLRYTWQWRSSWNDWRNGNAKFWYLANKSIRSHTYILNFRRCVWIVNCEWISSSDPILFLYLQPTHCYFILFIIFFAKFTPNKKKGENAICCCKHQATHTHTHAQIAFAIGIFKERNHAIFHYEKSNKQSLLKKFIWLW